MPKKIATTMKLLNAKTQAYKQPLQHKVIEAQKPERINQKQIFDKQSNQTKNNKSKKKKKTNKKY